MTRFKCSRPSNTTLLQGLGGKKYIYSVQLCCQYHACELNLLYHVGKIVCLLVFKKKTNTNEIKHI